MIQAMLSVSCLIGCGSSADVISDYVDRRTKSPLQPTETPEPDIVSPGVDPDLVRYVEEYMKHRPTNMRPPSTLRAMRWASQEIVSVACRMPADSTVVIGCAVTSAHDGYCTVVLSADWRAKLGDSPFGPAQIRNLAIHELGHCLDGFDHLPDGQRGIMQPNIDRHGFTFEWLDAMAALFTQKGL